MRRVRMSTVDSFLAKKGIKVQLGNLRTDFPYYGVVVASAWVPLFHSEKVDEIKTLAHVTSLARISKDDIGKEKLDTGRAIAQARAKRGLYALLRGKKIHDLLCQGVRL